MSSQRRSNNRIADTATGPADVDPQYLSTCGGQGEIPGEVNCILDGSYVDIYYWPEPDADTACLSIVGNNTNSPFPGATGGYWGCTASSGSSFITTATEVITGTVTLKQPLVNPWSPQPCIKTLGTRPSLQARDHSLIIPHTITQNGGLPITSVVIDNSTLSVPSRLLVEAINADITSTSPYIYAKFHDISASGACGITSVPQVILSFTSGELSTYVGSPQSYTPGGSVAPFDPADLPCPPQSVMVKMILC